MAKAKKEEVKTEEVKTEATETAETAPQLSVQDLVTLRSCIELGSQRGAWRANELTAVGAIYEKLSAFLQSLLPPKEEAEADESTAKKEGE